jgi:hypothetical protein
MGTNKVAAQIAGMQPGATNNTPTFTGPSAGGGANPWTSYSGNPNDPTQIDNYVKWLMSQPGEDPAVAGDEAYLDQRIAQTGGLTQDNMGYWNGRTKAGVYTAPEAGGSTSSTGQPGGQDIMSLLQSIFSQGTGGKTPSQTNPQLTSYLSGILQNPSSTFNQGLVNTEVMNARDQLEQGKQTGTQSLEAQLAARGLAGSGPETSGLEGLTAQLQNQFGNQVTDIYGKAGDQANSQLASAIAAATGLSEADATNLLSQYEATTQRGVGAAGALNSANQTGLGYAQLDLSKLLGEGSLGLQSNAQDIGLQEFLDTFGLQQQQQSSTQQHTQNQDLLAWIEANFPGAQLAAQGYQ